MWEWMMKAGWRRPCDADMQMFLGTHLTEGCIVMSQLCYQGGEVFGRHETIERGTDT